MPGNKEVLIELENTSLKKIDKETITDLLNTLLDIKLEKSGLRLSPEARVRLSEHFEKINITYDLNEIEFFKSKNAISAFAQKIAAKSLTGGFLVTYTFTNGAKSFEVYINANHPLSDAKKKLLHELSHIVDYVLASEFPSLFESETGENDLSFFISRGLVGITSIILINWAVYTADILPPSLQMLVILSQSLAMGLSMTSYDNRPNEVSARESEKLIPNKFQRQLNKLFLGFKKDR